MYPGMTEGDCGNLGFVNPIGSGTLWVDLRGEILMDMYNRSAYVPPKPPVNDTKVDLTPLEDTTKTLDLTFLQWKQILSDKKKNNG